MKKKPTGNADSYSPDILKGIIPGSAKDAELTEKKQAQIREAACNLFFKNGFHETSIREIATESGMSMGQLYHYISSKDDILFLVYKHMQELWYEHLVGFGFEKINDPLERLLKAARSTIDFAAVNKKLFQFVFSESKYLDKDHLKLILKMDNENYSGFFKKLLEEVNKKYTIKCDLDLTARFITYISLFMALRAWDLKEWPIDKIEDFMVTFILNGLGLKNKKTK